MKWALDGSVGRMPGQESRLDVIKRQVKKHANVAIRNLVFEQDDSNLNHIIVLPSVRD